MSEILFPQTAAPKRPLLRVKLAALGAAFALMSGLISLGVGLKFIGVIGGDLSVTARLSDAGDQLGVGSDVKFRGLRIGRVVGLDHRPDQHGHQAARVEIFSQFRGQVPAAVTARVVPGTVFGNEFIWLELKPTTEQLSRQRSDPGAASDYSMGRQVSGPWLQAGTTIPADATRSTTRLMQTFASLQRFLSAINPALVDKAVSQLADALAGNGDDLSRFIRKSDTLLATWATHEPQIFEDLRYLAAGADTISDLRPQMLQALHQSVPVAKRLAAEQRRIDDLLGQGTRGAKVVNAFAVRNGVYLTTVLAGMAATLTTFVDGTAAFESIIGQAPGVLRNGAQAVVDGKIKMDALFSFDTTAPYAAKDCPRYGDLAGKNCQ